MRHFLMLAVLPLLLLTSACNGAADETASVGALCEGEGPMMPTIDDSYVDGTGGLRYTDLRKGSGAVVASGSAINVHYAGFLQDGTMFDSSCTRNSTFPLTVGTGSVIQGWEQGLQGMNVGGRRVLVIPSDLAYGELGSPPTIPGNATLIFDVEVVE